MDIELKAEMLYKLKSNEFTIDL